MAGAFAMNATALEFIPGSKKHCPCNRDVYIQKVIETLSVPGGTPSHNFDVKFKADHGFDWIPEWAGVQKLEDLISAQYEIARWADNGQLVYGSKEVLVQRVFSEQQPPAPLCTIKGNELRIVPMLAFGFDGYEMHDRVRQDLMSQCLTGMNVKVLCKGIREQNFFLDSLPWVVPSLKPWFHYEISVQYYLHNTLTRFSKHHVIELDVNNVWEFVDWEHEKLWANCYLSYEKKIRPKWMRKKMKKICSDIRNWRNSMRKNKKCCKHNFVVDQVNPVRIVMRTSNMIMRTLQDSSALSATTENQVQEDSKVLKNIAKFGESVMAVHVLLTEKGGDRKRIVVMRGLSRDVKFFCDLVG